jgi:integrase
MLLEDWEAKGRRGMLQARARLKRLNRAFSGWHTAAITTDKVTSYALRRRHEGAAAATVNVEIAILHRAFVLAKRAGRLRDVPIMDRLPGVGHRTGTVERGDLEAILAHLAEKYRPPIWFLYWTGWRLGEALGLTWRRVDLEAGELRLDTSKSGEPRVLAFGRESALARLLRDVAASRHALSPYVFPGRAGHRMDRTAIEKAWRAACTAAGIPGRPLIHDLRRTMTRDLSRAGVPLAVAMATVGHRSLTIHQGYRIVAAQDQEDGLAQLEALRSGEPVQRRLAVIGGLR